MLLAACLFSAALFVPVAMADDVQDGPAQVLQQASPTYPEDVRAEALIGDVLVTLQVDAAGAITDATATVGPQPFRAAAEDAARRLVLSPAIQDGVAVPSTLKVRFHFEPPLEDDVMQEIVVHARSPDQEDSHARTTLSTEALERTAGSDLATTLSQVPGVVAAGGTTSQGKPIIRGQTERRLLLLTDGVRHEGQKWGPDHAPEIDPFSAGEISVIRGAAGARYGPDAIGGVVLVSPPPMRRTRGVGGKAMVLGATNSRQLYGALRLDGATGARERGVPWSVRVEGNHTNRSDAQSPTYVLGNTASHTTNGGMTLERQGTSTTLRLSYHLHQMDAGVFYGIRISTPEEFEAQLAAPRPVTADLWTADRAIDRPFQAVTHQIATARLNADLGGGWSMQAIYAFQHNHRQEFDQVRSALDGPQYDFVLRTHSADVFIEQPKLGLAVGTFTGGFGLQGRFIENVYTGWSLLPNYRSTDGGLFAVERLAMDRTDIEVGVRVDGLDRQVYMDDDDFGRHDSRGTLSTDDCTISADIAQCPTQYLGASASIAGLLHIVPEHVDLKADISTSSRFPDADELYLIGAAPSLPVFALGDPSLGVEHTWGNALALGLRWDWMNAELAGFWNRTSNFIYFAPDAGNDGQPAYEVTVEGSWPRYAYRPIDAVFMGTDGNIDVGPDALVGVQLSGSLVRAQDTATGDGLVGIPADRAMAQLWFRPPAGAWVEQLAFGPSVQAIAQQSRTPASLEFAPAPEGVVLLGASAQIEVPAGPHHVRVAVEGHNLLNTEWRDYSSLTRFYANESGRDVRVRATYDF